MVLLSTDCPIVVAHNPTKREVSTPNQVDVNRDGTVNTLDVVAVYVAMNTPEEPKPEESSGFDGQGTDTNNDYDFGGRGK